MSTIATAPFLQALNKHQLPDGSFAATDSLSALLHTALALDLMADLPQSGPFTTAKARAVAWLLANKNDKWQFKSTLAEQFYILAVLKRCAPESIDGTALAHILSTLTSREVQPGGPYRSFSDGQVDAGSNTAVAWFLSEYNVVLPHLDDLMQATLREGLFRSQELPSALFVRILSQAYKGDDKETLAEQLRKQDQAWKDLSPIIPPYTEEMEHQSVSPDADRMAMARCKEDNMIGLTLQQAARRFESLSTELRDHALAQIQRTIKANSDRQMSLMPFFFQQALGKTGERFSSEEIAQLGLMNVFFWTAFIIYDDFWDEDEAARPVILPTANLYARDFTKFFTHAWHDLPQGLDFFQTLMDNLDAANTWEVTHCRARVEGDVFYVPGTLPPYGDYHNKFAPASAHILGPVLMMSQLGYLPDSAETQALVTYFRHYLIPMQINDDLHDWREDFARGNISTVVAMMLEDLGPGRKTIHLEKDLPELQKLFWLKTLPRAVNIADKHLAISRKSLASLPMIEHPEHLARFIMRNENALHAAMDEQRQTLGFVETFAKTRKPEKQAGS